MGYMDPFVPRRVAKRSRGLVTCPKGELICRKKRRRASELQPNDLLRKDGGRYRRAT